MNSVIHPHSPLSTVLVTNGPTIDTCWNIEYRYTVMIMNTVYTVDTCWNIEYRYTVMIMNTVYTVDTRWNIKFNEYS